MSFVSLSTAAKIGGILRFLDKCCAFAYLMGAGCVGGFLVWKAFTQTLWLLLLAGPVLATTAVLAVSFYRSPALGLHFDWPLFGRQYRSIRGQEKVHRTNN